MEILDRLDGLVATCGCGACEDAAAEIRRLREREAELQAQCGYTESILTLQIERMRAERDEWQQKWMALAQASLIIGTMQLGHVDEQEKR
jgi:hypothetical protein